ncbi:MULTISPECIES: diacylglycerol kinase family protein [Enterococcus]|nr:MULTISPECIES: diacylglycerol kinase family protein [Enterococcus]MDA3964446.1 diacylglycerol kinase family protein [Enterococcus thailandicus]MDK4352497.1 diacylglycerol kinase family protein [Enterococcus thailandicus]MDT2734663.1 diacylglycerol kinase family protein [Enterococcus thailandicus]MDT2751122.1 diacylglycerol kinase family protein [Enterococcus thailandicus]MDT2775551.1 diacylglycerol kinase family protein [Enterococcus thailandicus]
MDLKDKQVEKNKHFMTSVEFAIQGVKTVFDEERNMKTHVVFGIFALIAGVIFQLSQNEWLWLFLAIFLVWIVEILNTVFENVVDMFTDFHFHPIGKKIKDMAAGAVLLTACFAVIVGLILFVPKIYQLFF